MIGGCFDDAPQPIAFHPTQDPISSTEQSHSLSCGSKSGTASVAVAYGIDEEQNAMREGFGCLKARMEGGGFEGTVALLPEVSGTLGGGSGQRGWSNDLDRSGAFVPQGAVVRRLTATECEALQGFPRNWTSEGIDKTGKRIPMADSSRYKQLGNAVTVNVAEWIARRVISCADAPSC